MARGGVNKVIVQKAREALLARGENPSIDAVRVELGNTGSKTTIHRYLKEIEAVEPRLQTSRERLSDELAELVSRLTERLMEEGDEVIAAAQAVFHQDCAALQAKLDSSQADLANLRQQHDIQGVALQAQTAEFQTCQTSLQAEITRNARISQNCSDLEVRVQEKDEQIRSLEDKHLHARDALEHYRTAIKEQREQEQRRHESQLQQLQLELRQLQQTLVVKQDDLTRLNRDNERLLGESRHHAKALLAQEDTLQRLTGEMDTLKTSAAKTQGANEMLKEHVIQLRTEAKGLADAVSLANDGKAEACLLLEAANVSLEELEARLRLNDAVPPAD